MADAFSQDMVTNNQNGVPHCNSCPVTTSPGCNSTKLGFSLVQEAALDHCTSELRMCLLPLRALPDLRLPAP